MLRVTGGGAYTLQIDAAGDLNRDGRVDGTDSDLLRIEAPGADITGDGRIDAQDRAILGLNFGLRGNAAPVPADVLPEVFTHVDLSALLDLSEVATDAEGDPIFFRIVSTDNITARFTPDGEALRVTPDAGFSGAGSITVTADDGFSTSPEIVIPVTISDAALTDIQLLFNNFAFDEPGQVGEVVAIGQFEDQADVLLDGDYVTFTLEDPTVAQLSSTGVLTALKDGDTYLTATRGSLTAAAGVRVGIAPSGNAAIAQLFGIDAYPDTVTILPGGGSRQIVTSVGTTNDEFLSADDPDLVYISSNTDIVTVTAGGLMEAVSEGATTVTVIYRGAQEILDVKVAQPIEAASARIGSEGGALRTPDGIEIAFGRDQLVAPDGAEAPLVSAHAMTEAELEVDVPPDFDFVAGGSVSVTGGEINGPVQLAAQVTGDAQAGDKVYFFVQDDFTEQTNGEYGKIWRIVDSGIVGDDGMARTASPPFPGFSERGNYLVARANAPVVDGSLAVAFLARTYVAVIPGMAIGLAVGGLAGATVGLAIGLNQAAGHFVANSGIRKIATYQQFLKDGDFSKVELDVKPGAFDSGKISLVGRLPKDASVDPAGEDIVIEKVTPLYSSDASGNPTVKVRITGQNLTNSSGFGSSIGETRIRYTIGNFTGYIDPANIDATGVDENGSGTILFNPPNNILVSRASFFFERPNPAGAAGDQGGWSQGTEAISSQKFDVKNLRGYGAVGGTEFVGGLNRTMVQFFDILPDEITEDQLNQEGRPPQATEVIRNVFIKDGAKDVLNYWPGDVLMAPDLSATFVSTREGVAIIDMLTLTQFDASPHVESRTLIDIPGSPDAKLSLDPAGNFLYVSGQGKIHVVDLRPESDNYLRVRNVDLKIAGRFKGNPEGRITSITTDASGRKLYVAVPDSGIFGPNGWLRGEQRGGRIFVVNVDVQDAPTNDDDQTSYLTVIGELGANDKLLEPYDIEATPDDTKLAFVTRGNVRDGVFVINVTNTGGTKDSYSAEITKLRSNDPGKRALDINKGGIGVLYDGIVLPYPPILIDDYRPLSSQKYDLNINNAVGIEIAPDLSYAFVADYDLSRYFTFNDSRLAYEIEQRHFTGNNIGLIRNPFDMDEAEWQKLQVEYEFGRAGHVGSTTPVPNQFLTDIALRPDGTQLLANYKISGTLVTFNVDKLIRASDLGVNGASGPAILNGRPGTRGNNEKPVDLERGNFSSDGAIIRDEVFGDPLNIVRWGRGLDIQAEAGLELIRPAGIVDLRGEGAEKPVFEVHLDPEQIGLKEYELDFFLSTQPPGQGLFPGDPFRVRNDLGGSDPSTKDQKDYHPYRLINTAAQLPSGTKLVSGFKYNLTLEQNGSISVTSVPIPVEAVPDGRKINHVLQIEIDPAYVKSLTGGGEFYWGVSIGTDGTATLRDSRKFIPEVNNDDKTKFSTVNVLTHGFQLEGLLPDFGNTPLNEDTLAYWLLYGDIINEASGGGTILVYNRQTGKFHEYYPSGFVGQKIAKEAVDVTKLDRGKAITLVMDWYRESNISDAGFSEAAADAFFASIVQLNEDTGKDLFKSPLHFIGHSRGASVNSEIIQRLGANFKKGAAGSPVDIHMTTLDPHDFKQDSLKVDAETIIKNWIRVFRAAAAITAVFAPPVGAAALRALNVLENGIQALLKIAGYLGIQVAKIQWDDFKDPNVQVWSNVDFADNYFQTSENESQSALDKYIPQARLIPVTTPNGSKIPTEKDGKDKVPGPKNKFTTGEADIELNFTASKVPGFTQSDVFASPHTRVTSWYMGTADLDALYIGGQAIPRTRGDAGLNINDGGSEGGFVRDLVSLVEQEFTTLPYYAVNPRAFSASWTQLDTHFKNYYKFAARTQTGTGQGTVRAEATGSGFYFSTVARDPSVQKPDAQKKRTSIDFDNTEVDRPDLPKGVTRPAVPTIFNGDFSHGTRQSMTDYILELFKAGLTDAIADRKKWQDVAQEFKDGVRSAKGVKAAFDAAPTIPETLGRFPLSYDLPGWGMHGGIDHGNEDIDEGNSFTFDLFTAGGKGGIGLDGPVDITGLFLVNQNVSAQLISVLKTTFDALIKVLSNYLTNTFDQKQENKPEDVQRDNYHEELAKENGGTVFKDTIPVIGSDGLPKKDDDGNVITQNITKIVDADGKTIVGNEALQSITGSWLKGLKDRAAETVFVAKIVDDMIAKAWGSDLVKNALNLENLPKGVTITGAAPSLAAIYANPIDRSTPETEEAGLKARAGEVEKIMQFAIKNFTALITAAFFPAGWKIDTKPDYGLIFGGSAAIKSLFKEFLPLGTEAIFGEKTVTDVIDSAFDALGQTEKLTHNRFLIPEGATRLSFDAVLPAVVSSGVGLEVSFSTLDGTIHKAKTVTGEDTWTFDRGFFQRTTPSFALPEGLAGKVVNMTIKHVGFENAQFGNVLTDLAEQVIPNLNLIGSGLAGLSQVMILDNVRMVVPASNQTADSIGAGTDKVLALTEAQALAEVAEGIWIESDLIPNAAGILDNITIQVGDLDGTQLAVVEGGVITLDADAAGHGWFVDQTPRDQSEFIAGAFDHTFRAELGSDAEGGMDLLTVLLHEMGNAMGLSDLLDPTGDGFVMTPVLSTGLRRLPSGPDVGDWSATAEDAETQVETEVFAGLGPRSSFDATSTSSSTSSFSAPASNIAPRATQAFANGDFDDGETGWTTSGEVNFQNGVAELGEASAQMAGLSQAFELPAEATAVQVFLSDVTLSAAQSGAPDAFEIGLFDAATGQAVLPAIVDLPGTDAALNIQADGAQHLSAGVGVLAGAGGGFFVTLDLTALATRPDGLILTLDLIGLGSDNSSVTVDSVRLLGPGQNEAPVAEGERAATLEDTPVVIDLLDNDSDPDGDPLILQIASIEAGATLVPVAGGLFRYTPAPESSGEQIVTYRLSDGVDRSEVVTLTVDVTPVNDTPALEPVEDIRAALGTTVVVDLVATDPDAAPGELVFELTQAPDGATIDPTTGRISFTVTELGLNTFTASVMDAGDLASTASFTITALEPPVLGAHDLRVREGTALSATLSASDPDGDDTELRFSLTEGPDWLSIDPLTGGLSGDTTGRGGIYAVTAIVTDTDGLTAQATFSLRVEAVPTIAAASVVLVEGEALNSIPLVEDADSPEEELSFFKVTGPDWINVDPDTGAITGDTTGEVGVTALTIRVTDAEGLTAETDLTVTVRARPEISVSNVVLTQGDMLAVSPSVSDEDTALTALVFAKLAGPDWISVDPDTGEITGDSTGQAGEADVRLSVTDPDGLSATATLTVDVDVPPTLTLADIVVVQGDLVDATPQLLDPDNDAGTARFALTSGPDWISIDPATGALTGNSQGHVGTAPLTVTVTDADDLTATLALTLTVLDDPEILPETLTLTEGARLDTTLRTIDEDTARADLTFAKLSGPDWVQLDPATGVLTGDSSGQGGEVTIRVSVTDTDGLSSETAITITILSPPTLTGPNVVLVTGDALSVQLIGADLETPSAGLSYAKTAGPDWVTVDAISGLVTGDSSGQTGETRATFTVTDGDGLTGSVTIDIDVNAPPTLSLSDATLVRGDALNLTPTTTDIDTPADALRYTLLSAPDWVSIDAATGVITGDTAGQTGPATLRISVRDADGLTAEATATVTVLAPPLLAPLSISRIVGEPILERLKASDDDGALSELRFSVVSGPDWLSLDEMTGTLSGDTTGQKGRTQAVLRVTDADGLSADVTVTLDISEEPRPPAQDATTSGLFSQLTPVTRVAAPLPPALPGPQNTLITSPAVQNVVSGRSPFEVASEFRFRGGGAVQLIPVLFSSTGGVREAVLEVTHRARALQLLDASCGRCLPDGVEIAYHFPDETSLNRMIVTLTADPALPEGAFDLFYLRAFLDEDPAAADTGNSRTLDQRDRH
ncbi:putative Ig domain-containing protein [Roseobacteraceae bacterium S113]